jgi:hypothetical protein
MPCGSIDYVPVAEGVELGLGLGVLETVDEAELLSVALGVAEGVELGLVLGVLETVDEAELLSVALGVAEGVRLGVDDGVALTLGVELGVEDGVFDSVELGVALAVLDGVADSVALGVREGVALGLGLGVALGVALGVPDGLVLGVDDGVLETVADGVRLGVADGVAEVVCDGVLLAVCDGLGLGVLPGLMTLVTTISGVSLASSPNASPSFSNVKSYSSEAYGLSSGIFRFVMLNSVYVVAPPTSPRSNRKTHWAPLFVGSYKSALSAVNGSCRPSLMSFPAYGILLIVNEFAQRGLTLFVTSKRKP